MTVRNSFPIRGILVCCFLILSSAASLFQIIVFDLWNVANLTVCILLFVFSIKFYKSGTVNFLLPLANGISLFIVVVSPLIYVLTSPSFYGFYFSFIIPALSAITSFPLYLYIFCVSLRGSQRKKTIIIIILFAMLFNVGSTLVTAFAWNYIMGVLIVVSFGNAVPSIFLCLALLVLLPDASAAVYRRRHPLNITKSLEMSLREAKAQYDHGQLSQEAYEAIKVELLSKM